MKTKRTNPSFNFSGFDDWVEVFRAGSQTDASGKTTHFSQSDLDSIVENHEPAPIVIGHPKTNDPAFGWTQALKREGDSLVAKFTDVEPEFAALVEQRRYPERSIRIKPVENGYQLMHVGFLGAVRPAVSGMKPIEFNEQDSESALEFSGQWHVTGTISRFFRRFKNYLIDDKGEELADKLLPEWELESLSDAIAEQRMDELSTDNAFSQFNHPEQTTGDDPVPEITQQQLDDAVAAAAKKAKQEAQQEFSEAMAQAESKRRKAEALRRVDELLAKQKLMPAQTAGLAEFMASLSDTEESSFEFSVSDADQSGTQTQSPAQFFNAFLDNLPEHGLLDDQSMGGFEVDDTSVNTYSNVDADRQQLHEKALQYQASHDGVDYITAVKAVGG